MKKKRVPKFKILLESRYEDTELKMNIRYDVPITQLGRVIEMLEKNFIRSRHKK